MAMKIFIWQCAGGVTENYHDEGGVVVLAPSLEEARKLLPGAIGDGITPECSAYTEEPDHVLDVDAPFAITFKDAGCC